jgi:hypothetical protein
LPLARHNNIAFESDVSLLLHLLSCPTCSWCWYVCLVFVVFAYFAVWELLLCCPLVQLRLWQSVAVIVVVAVYVNLLVQSAYVVHSCNP